ncbi:unnamed protein product [Lepeophtheirus salmonis]|uniref:(salmon louse) hypothetical protein n=1 Tax=Lepeophtheirus salmonis TaxID=72036 RepID=A0A7R8CQD9_LEPSM|nr:unnamed protein product [Lepeophtheirus salmonis]CAF2858698.1 unnamed protein product [Lepeophtheirus salmonis]
MIRQILKIQVNHLVSSICFSNNMLHGLAKKLRATESILCILKTSNPELLADAALKSNRVILSRGKIVDRIASSRPDVSVYNVISNKAQDQVKEIIRKFDIKVSEEDIFKRCVLCNSDQYIVISQSEMIFLSHCQITSSKREIIIGEVHKISLPSVTNVFRRSFKDK